MQANLALLKEIAHSILLTVSNVPMKDKFTKICQQMTDASDHTFDRINASDFGVHYVPDY